MNETIATVQNHLMKNRIAYMLGTKLIVIGATHVAIRFAVSKALEECIIEGTANQPEE